MPAEERNEPATDFVDVPRLAATGAAGWAGRSRPRDRSPRRPAQSGRSCAMPLSSRRSDRRGSGRRSMRPRWSVMTACRATAVFERSQCESPWWCSSCPELASRWTVRRGVDAARCSASASQMAIPPPRSAAHVNQPDFGVITTSGAASGSEPSIVAITLVADDSRRSPSTSSTPSTPTSIAAARSRIALGATCSTGSANGRSMYSALRRRIESPSPVGTTAPRAPAWASAPNVSSAPRGGLPVAASARAEVKTTILPKGSSVSSPISSPSMPPKSVNPPSYMATPSACSPGPWPQVRRVWRVSTRGKVNRSWEASTPTARSSSISQPLVASSAGQPVRWTPKPS